MQILLEFLNRQAKRGREEIGLHFFDISVKTRTNFTYCIKKSLLSPTHSFIQHTFSESLSEYLRRGIQE